MSVQEKPSTSTLVLLSTTGPMLASTPVSTPASTTPFDEEELRICESLFRNHTRRMAVRILELFRQYVGEGRVNLEELHSAILTKTHHAERNRPKFTFEQLATLRSARAEIGALYTRANMSKP